VNTPIFDFVSEYEKKDCLRFHMPGHKGQSYLGCEAFDITEITGADSLYQADGIIEESEKNAGLLFESDTFYSAEGSSLCIKAMLYLARMYYKKRNKINKRQTVIAGRNAHKSFIDAAALLDFDVEWIYSSGSYMTCDVTLEKIEAIFKKSENVSAVYITSPDYLGNMTDKEEMKKISEFCKKNGILFLVDNAHGAYLKFLEQSLHPTDFGADMVCDSAHKTLPVLTGGAYLHISKTASCFLKENAKSALSLFGSTSPSYLILQSLDLANKYLSEGYTEKLCGFLKKVNEAKKKLKENGYLIYTDEPLKITISAKSYGYKGDELAKILEEDNIICEFSDPDFVVFMLTPENKDDELKKLIKKLLLIEKRAEIFEKMHETVVLKRAMSIREAVFSNKEEVYIEDCVGRILAASNISCPPAVSIAVCGEIITKEAVEAFSYYTKSKKKCLVVKE